MRSCACMYCLEVYALLFVFVLLYYRILFRWTCLITFVAVFLISLAVRHLESPAEVGQFSLLRHPLRVHYQ